MFWELVSFDARGNGPLKLVHGKLAGQPVRFAIVGKGAKFNVPPGGYYWYNEQGHHHERVARLRDPRQVQPEPAVGFIELWHREPDEPNYVKQIFRFLVPAHQVPKIFYATLLRC